MKTLGRILIILAVTALVTGALYLTFNSADAGVLPDKPAFSPDAPSPDFEGDRADRDEMRGGWMFGLTKNLGVISVLVTVMVLPKSVGKRKRLAAAKANSPDAG